MMGLTWEVDRFAMPEGALLIAYDYYDEEAKTIVGYRSEILYRIKYPVWKLTGIGQMQLEAQA